jgi:2-oxoisovalerate dehydrogenase E2 component (dihydrolipoyl transacylase)
MTAFNLPDLGEGLREAEIVAWHVAEGDHVVTDQPLVSVETEKAVVEIPCPQPGHIAKLLVKAGDHVPVGAPLLLFEDGPHAESGTVVGELASPAASLPAPPPQPATSRVLPQPARVAPAVRARARELGIDVSQVTPTGPGGSVTMADLKQAAIPPINDAQTLRGARRAMALNMTKAGREVVAATLYDDADVNSWNEDEDVTVRLIRAIIAGCAAEPLLNVQFDATQLALVPNMTIDVGLAVDSPEGLFVPVLRDVARSGPESWRQQIDAMKISVKERLLKPAELRGPTITLSNFGLIGGAYAALVVMPPQVAILGAGRIKEQAARSKGELVWHRMLPLSLTFDHRAITGGEATRFLGAVVDDLQKQS